MSAGEVLEGDYKGKFVAEINGRFFIRNWRNIRELSAVTIKDYKKIDKDNAKSLGSVIGRGVAGALLFGGVGAIVGGYTAKSNGTILLIEFRDGKRSVISIPDDLFFRFYLELEKVDRIKNGEKLEDKHFVEEVTFSDILNNLGVIYFFLYTLYALIIGALMTVFAAKGGNGYLIASILIFLFLVYPTFKSQKKKIVAKREKEAEEYNKMIKDLNSQS